MSDLTTKVAVCSRSFSRNILLRNELLSRYPNTKFNDDGHSLNGADLVDFLKGAEKAITALEVIDEEILSQLPDLRVIGKYGVGLDMIDLKAMRQFNVRLGWTGGVNKRSVSEMVVSLAISLLRLIPNANNEVLNGKWRQHIGSLLTGTTIGIIGCGNIGKDLVEILINFNCRILAYDIKNYNEFYDLHNIEPVDLETLLIMSDVVSLHVPLNNSTRNILNSNNLCLMKATSILINTARGGLVDEIALKVQLKNKSITAAAFDVFNEEPPKDFELLHLENFFVTPHIAGSAQESILAMGKSAIDGLDNNFIPEKNFE
jgi:phosphoglycerate dehydrogenase-like enzyme